MVALTGEELQAWVEQTAHGWKELLAAHPEVLSFPCDVRETSTVAELLQHIVAVELRYAERLHGMPETPYEEIPFGSGDEIYGTHDQAMALLRKLQNKDESFWEEWISFSTRKGGSISVSRRRVLVHTLMHSIRHYAQLATLVRQYDVVPHWQMDYLFMRPNPQE